MKQNVTNIILEYFSGFAHKSIKTVMANLSGDVVLRDWVGYWEGDNDVSDAIQSIFDNVDSIIIVPTTISISDSTASNGLSTTVKATCLIDIIITLDNEVETIKAVDIITLRSNGSPWLITEIDAYKQS